MAASTWPASSRETLRQSVDGKSTGSAAWSLGHRHVPGVVVIGEGGTFARQHVEGCQAQIVEGDYVPAVVSVGLTVAGQPLPPGLDAFGQGTQRSPRAVIEMSGGKRSHEVLRERGGVLLASPGNGGVLRLQESARLD